MERRRFGAGIAAGLLLGFIIVFSATGSAGFLGGGLFGSFTSNDNQVGKVALSTTSTSFGTDSSVQTSISSTTGSYQATPPSTSGSNATNPASVGTATTPAFAFGPVLPAKSPSQLNSIASQPVATDGIVLIPILIALLLGAVLYWFSRSGRTDEREAVGQA